MSIKVKITPCLWFDNEAEAAANFYIGIFPNSRITQVAHYGKEGFEIHQRPEGSVLTVAFELDGQPMLALNAGPQFKFNEAVSLMIDCATQDEVDHYWNKLTAGGDPNAQQCGWLRDRYGLSWQVVPDILPALVGNPRSAASQRAMKAMMQMKKLDFAGLQRAYKGE